MAIIQVTKEIDCTDTHCNRCHIPRRNDVCKLFGKELIKDTAMTKLGERTVRKSDYKRCAPCLEAEVKQVSEIDYFRKVFKQLGFTESCTATDEDGCDHEWIFHQNETSIAVYEEKEKIVWVTTQAGSEMKFENMPLKIAIESIFPELTDDERLHIFSEYCTHCGTKDPRCYCSKDE